MDTNARLQQIEKIAQNARTTWFGLLALLVFVGVTLMGHKDSDFFAYGAATKLPIVGIDVPPTYFFYAAPLLTAAVYCYLHIFLLDLWEGLGKIEQKKLGRPPPLAERTYPILFTLAALWYRNRVRKDGSMAPRVLGMWTIIIAVLLGWVFGWIIVGFLWWRSMPLHDPWMTIVAGLCLWATLDFGVNGFLWARTTLSDPEARAPTHWRGWRIFLSALVVTALVCVSWARAKGGFEHLIGDPWITSERVAKIIPLARADLREAELTRKPKDWTSYKIWLVDATSAFRRRNGLDAAEALSPEMSAALEAELADRWNERAQSLDNLSLQGRDLRQASMNQVFLTGADLREADLTGADLSSASLQSADIRWAVLNGVNLESAEMQGTHLWFSLLRDADFSGADLQGALLIFADLQGASLGKAKNVPQTEIDQSFGDARTSLPEGVLRPCYWPKEKDPSKAEERYDSWLRSIKSGVKHTRRNPDGTCP